MELCVHAKDLGEARSPVCLGSYMALGAQFSPGLVKLWLVIVVLRGAGAGKPKDDLENHK